MTNTHLIEDKEGRLMKIEKILNYLKELFKQEIPNKKFYDNMTTILSKLKKQELMLEAQLKNEKNEKKYKDINLKLKIISKHIKKGKRLIQEKCSLPSRKYNATQPNLLKNTSRHAI